MPLPTTFTSGDAFTATITNASYPAGAGWSAQMVLIGPTRQTITGTASGDDFVFTADSAATASWAAGSYTARILYTLAGARTTVESGTLQVLPDPAAGGTDARALMGTWARILADLEAAYQAHITSGRAVVGSYSIGGRSMSYQTTAELVRAIDNARREVAREEAAAKLLRGESARNKLQIRM